MAFIAVVLFIAGLYGVIRGKVAGPINTRGKSALLILAGFFFEIIRGVTSPTPPATPPIASTPAVTSPTKPAAAKEPVKPVETYNYTAEVDGVKYKGKTASSVGVAVVEVKTADTIGSEYFKKKAQGKYVLVQVAITNGQKDKIMLSGGSFKILSNGKEYSDSSDGAIAFGSDKGAIIFDELNPDLTKVGWVIFDVPQSLDPANAQLQFSGGVTGKSGTLPLAPIKG